MSNKRQKRNIYRERRPNCHWCLKHLTEKRATLDHVLPKSHGGTLRRDNIELSCKACNNLRGDMDYDEFAAVMANSKARRRNEHAISRGYRDHEHMRECERPPRLILPRQES